MVLITIVTGAYKPTYNWGASHCRCTYCAGGMGIEGAVKGNSEYPSFVELPRGYLMHRLISTFPNVDRR